MRLRVLGAPVLEHGSGTLPFSAGRRFQLLALLAHHADWVGRPRLAALLWPDLIAERSRSNLRKLLFGLREWRDVLTVEDRHGALRWTVPTDLQSFEAALDAGDAVSAVNLWQGEPWEGMGSSESEGFDGWLNFERQRLRARWRDALLRLCVAESDPTRATSWADRLLDHDPLDEEAVQIKMRCCARSGRKSDQARLYQAYAKTLADAVGIEPLASTRALLEASDGSIPRPLPSLDEVPTTEARDHGFIGRRAEARELASQLTRNECRWVSLLGPGGIGKTRFLLHVLPSLAEAFPDGAVYVPLEDLDEPNQVLPRLAQRLAVPLDGGGEPLERLQHALQGSRLLLALDNFEPVRGAALSLFELLGACSGLRVVATSRERVAIAGEWTLRLDGLPFPDVEDSECAETFDAVRLFVRQALASQPLFDLDRERRDVVALCAFVEGLPLALELAAVWTRQFSVAEIVRDLRAHGQIFVESDPARPLRQQSIVATLEHSWNRLAGAEREALARATVFRAGFTREAAHAVAGASLGVLMALVDKSLCRSVLTRGTPRFFLHPLVQQFANARLNQDPAMRDATSRKYAEYYCQLLARYQGGTPSLAWAGEVDAETENIAQAWNNAVSARLRVSLTSALMGFVSHAYRNGHWDTGLAALDAARSVHGQSSHERARLDCYRAVLQLNLGLESIAVGQTRLALCVLRDAGDLKALQACLYYHGMASLHLGDLVTAESSLRESLRLAEEAENPVGQQSSLSGLVDVLRETGRYEDAISLTESAHIDDEWWLGHIADFHRLAGRPAQALKVLANELAAPAPTSHDSYLLECRWMVLQTAAAAHFDLGDKAGAERLAELAAAAQRELGRGEVPIVTLATCFLRARLASMRGDAVLAHGLLSAASAVAIRRRSRKNVVRAAVHWARLLAALGEHSRAAELAAMAMAEPTASEETRRIGHEVVDLDHAPRRVDHLATTVPVLATLIEWMQLLKSADEVCLASFRRYPAARAEA